MKNKEGEDVRLKQGKLEKGINKRKEGDEE
jgi:hypothetical protein